MAMTVDTLRNWLQFLWSQWTATDAEKKKRQRGRAPKTPPLLPYALRPPEVTELLEQAASEATPKTSTTPDGDRSGMRRMSIEELSMLI